MNDPGLSNNARIRQLLGWLLTPGYLVVFLFTVLLWHPLIVSAFYFGPRIYHAVIALGNGALILGLRLAGTRVQIEGIDTLPPARPLIVVSNHQSLYDIPFLLWFFRSRLPCFIAKQELGRGIPSASHALRHMGSVLIDRSNSREAIKTIEAFGARMAELGRAAVIFPEGTRARDGHMKRFKVQGVLALTRTMPNAAVVPVAISGSWHITQWGLFPVYPFASIRLTVLKPLSAQEVTNEAAVQDIESKIRAMLPAREATPPPPRAARPPLDPETVPI
jgi:1-acyl-sn-glycerol-3-phosphate acyltransferase